jgi:predicted peptidase
MDIKYTNMFAASFLVAGQWDATKVAPMAKMLLWMVCCQGDGKAYPGMTAITATLKNNGATISNATWNRNAITSEFATDVSKMEAKNSNVNFTVLTNGNHRETWRVAYTISGIRDWLFKQTKASKS